MLHGHMLCMRCRHLKKDMVGGRMKYQETGDSTIRNQRAVGMERAAKGFCGWMLPVPGAWRRTD